MILGSAARMLSLEDAVQYMEGASLSQSSLETLACIIQRCTKEKESGIAMRLHAYMHRSGLDTHEILGNYLVLMLVDVGCVRYAQQVFNRLLYWDEHSCNSILTGYLKCGKPLKAFALHQRMHEHFINLSERTIVLLLKACAEYQNLEKGLELHATAVRMGLLENNLFVGSTMLDMYTKFGLLEEAQLVFDKLPVQDVVSWTALMAGYVEHGLCKEALDCFEQMQEEGVSPNAVSYIYGLKACGSLGDLLKGKEFHAEVGRLGFLEKHLSVGSILVDMYAKCGLLVFAREVFESFLVQDVVSWTVLIAGYAEHGLEEKAFECLEQMLVQGAFPTAVTIVCSLKACSSVRAMYKGQRLHMEIERQGLLGKNHLVASTLVSMYAKCGLVDKAQEVFDKLPIRDIGSWTALISGYTEQGYFEEACKRFDQMESEGFSPDSTALVCCLKACYNLGEAEKVQQLIAKIEQNGSLEGDILTRSTLVEMYAKCGSIAVAQQVFDNLPVQDVVAWTSLIAGYMEHGSGEQALQCLEQAQQQGILPNVVTFVCCLKACIITKAINKGQKIHARFESQGLVENDLAIGNILIDFYTKCGLLAEAEQVFDRLPSQDVHSWTSLIAGNVEHGNSEQALACLKLMQSDGVTPGAFTLLCCLKASISVNAVYEALELHAEVERRELFESDLMVGNTLVELYARLGWLAKSRELLDRLPVRNVVSWNALIAGCAEYGHGCTAVNLYEEMQLECIFPNALTFVSCLKACSISQSIDKGQEFHAEIERLRFSERDSFVGSTLIDMYVKCNSLSKAQQVFDKLLVRDTVSWTALTAGYVAYGFGEKVLFCFEQMQLEGIFPNALTCICVLKACGSMGATKKGHEIHVKVNTWGLPERDLVGNTLMGMYAECGSLAMAMQVFDKLPVQDALTWEALIEGCVTHGGYEEALKHFEHQGVFPNVTTGCSLVAHTSSGTTGEGPGLDNESKSCKLLEKTPAVGNILVELYSKCGLVKQAEHVFDKLPARNTGSWNALMAGYTDHGHSEKAIACFEQMQHESIYPDALTLMCILKACISIGAASRVWEFLNEFESKWLLERDSSVGSVLVNICIECGSLTIARQVSDKLPSRDSTLWTSLIAGYTEYECGEDALSCYEQMQRENVFPSTAALVCVLKACGSIGAVDKGRQVHVEVEARGLLDKDLVGNSLINMYMKCGLPVEGRQVFDQLRARDVVSWTALMTGYGHLGESQSVFDIFDWMLGAAVKPDSVSFLVVLNACSRMGLFAKSEMYLEAMSKVHGFAPSLKHHTCVVDLLGRSGHLDTAVMRIKKIPLSPNLITWHTVLSACTGWGNIELGNQAFNHAMCLDNQYAGAYILMSQIYAGGELFRTPEQHIANQNPLGFTSCEHFDMPCLGTLPSKHPKNAGVRPSPHPHQPIKHLVEIN